MKTRLLSLLFSLAIFIGYIQPSLATPTEAFFPKQRVEVPGVFPSEPAYVERVFAKNNPLIIALSFLGLGLLLAFTPCVLPMVPILSSIIIGQHKKRPGATTFRLSLAYVAGMAVTYAMAGMAAALIGSHVQIALQKSWTIALLSGIFVLLGLSLLGLYELRLPLRWQKRLTELSNRQKGGTYWGVFIMGGISTLILSPCISPALVGVLTYVAHTGNVGLGGLALLSLGIGMGLPLLLVGASLGKFLPKTGDWMQTIEHLAGMMLLAVAIWLLSRIIPGPVTLFLWSILFILFAIVIGRFSKSMTQWQPVRHTIAALSFIYGLILLIGAVLGNSNPFHPWENLYVASHLSPPKKEIKFVVLQDMTQLNQALTQAKQEKKWVILDFHADWCESCMYMERSVFPKSEVQQALAPFILLRGDVTADTDFDGALMERFRIVGTPTLLFFTPDGRELTAQRLVGPVDAADLVMHIEKLKGSTRAY